jgi:hyaluronan synthase
MGPNLCVGGRCPAMLRSHSPELFAQFGGKAGRIRMFALLCLIAVLPLGVELFRFAVMFWVKFINPKATGVVKDYSYEPTVSVILPCYNEGRAVYNAIRSIYESAYPRHKIQICAQDDSSTDNSFGWILKARRDFGFTVEPAKNEQNIGKSNTYLKTMDRCRNEVVVIVDSDIILGKNCIRELVAALGDKRIGACGGPVGVRNPNDNSLTAFQVYFYFFWFKLAKIAEASTRSVGCIGGYMLAIRRSLLQDIRPEIERRQWWGVAIKSGEDRFLTHQVALRGYGTYMNDRAMCWTIVPNTFKKFWVQQLRWRRSGLRDFFFTIRILPEHVWHLHPGYLFSNFFVPITTVLCLVKIWSWFLNADPTTWVSVSMVTAYLTLSFIIISIVNHRHPEQRVRNPLKLSVFGLWWLASGLFMTTLALFTLDSDDWGNR